MTTLGSPVYRHEALPYAGHEEFVKLTADFLGAGVSAGEPGVLVTRGSRLRDVRDALGSVAADVKFVDIDVAGHNPALVFSVLHDFVRNHADRPVRGIGELIHEGRSPAELGEAELHELLLNTPACREWNMWLACPYNVEGLDDAAVRAVRASHPGDGRDLTNAAAAKFQAPLPPRPEYAETFPVDSRDLAAVRSVVRTAARMAGLAEDRVDAFVCAVNEVVTNSVRHGSGPAEVALWSVDDSLVCEVHDGGRIRDPFAGRLPPALGDTNGRGLWLVNNLCDLVQVRGPASGTSVRMHIER